MLRCNGVFEGGGVRGVGHVGAICALSDSGYAFENLAGSSAGAIVAALLAAGYSCTELSDIMTNVDYRKFKQKTGFDYFGVFGEGINLMKNLGVYSADYFQDWMEDLLRGKGKTRFGDIRVKGEGDKKRMYKLQVTASDVTTQKLLVFPWSAVLFGIDPDDMNIAESVRMSMSIPFFYKPYVLRDEGGLSHYLVDGGLLSNYPIWLLDDGKTSEEYPTFGFKFTDTASNGVGRRKKDSVNIVTYSKMIMNTAMGSMDKAHLSESRGDSARSIMIPATVRSGKYIEVIEPTDFDINKEEVRELFENGYRSGKKFISKWDFESWRKKFR